MFKPDESTPLLQKILYYFTPKEQVGLNRLKYQTIGNLIALGMPANEETVLFKNSQMGSVKDVQAHILNKSKAVMYGAGKDSSAVLAGERAIHRMVRDEYEGVTYKLRVGVGLHPGAIDFGPNVMNAFEALELLDDPDVETYLIAGHRVFPFNRDLTIPEEVIWQARHDVMINAHIHGGAGRRTYCDLCNNALAGWIAAFIAHKGPNGRGADLFVTGDSRHELRSQINGGIPKAAKIMGIELPKNQGLSPTQYDFQLASTVFDGVMQNIFVDKEQVAKRSIPYQNIDPHTKFMPFFSPGVPYECKGFDDADIDTGGYESKRMQLLHELLGFSLEDEKNKTLQFSFTETDCANPSAMAEAYGYIAQYAFGHLGATYEDGIKMYVRYALKKMDAKGMTEGMKEIMLKRYEMPEAIAETRLKLQDYMRRAYHIEPEHMVAWVFTPFTQNCTNLRHYLKHLEENGQTPWSSLPVAENIVKKILSSKEDLKENERPVIEYLEKMTGATLGDMRLLNSRGLARNWFDPKHRKDDWTQKLTEVAKQDFLYRGFEKLLIDAAQAVVEIPMIEIEGR